MFQNDCTIFSMLFSKQKAIQKVTIAFSRLIYVTFSRVNDRSCGHDVLFDYNNCGVILNGRSSIHTQTPSHIFYTMISDIAGQCLAAKRKVYTFKNEWECYKIQTSPISDWPKKVLLGTRYFLVPISIQEEENCNALFDCDF